MGLPSQVVTALGLCVSLERVMTHILISPKHMSVFVGKFKELRIDRPFLALSVTARHLNVAVNAGIVRT